MPQAVDGANITVDFHTLAETGPMAHAHVVSTSTRYAQRITSGIHELPAGP